MTLTRVNTNGIADGSVNTADLADAAVTEGKLGAAAVTTAKVADSAITTAKMAFDGGALGSRNRIINGDMRIDQRNAGASMTTNGGFSVDRWQSFFIGGGAYSSQRSTTAPAGYANSLLLTVTTADTSVGSTDYYMLRQSIEGFNVDDMAWGTANARTVTLSFWVRSSVAGTYGGSVTNAANRSYAFSYAVNAANTFEYKTITIPGETTGAWAIDNSIGLQINFGLGMGSAYSGSPGSWTNTTNASATGATNWIGTNGATFYITGVQLEAGTVATPFERRSYGQELALCERYCQTLVCGSGSGGNAFVCHVYATTAATATVAFRQKMRATPSITLAPAGTGSGQMMFYTTTGGTPAAIGTHSALYISSDGFSINAGSYTASGWTAGACTAMGAPTGTTTIYVASAEL